MHIEARTTIEAIRAKYNSIGLYKNVESYVIFQYISNISQCDLNVVIIV